MCFGETRRTPVVIKLPSALLSLLLVKMLCAYKALMKGCTLYTSMCVGVTGKDRAFSEFFLV